ncbi:YqcI/YcgG family protein [Alkalicoccobacillus murimartini]|uniref:FPC/CPF motif-containing protein YcgG n=1 Tax=Alkalicoccobacillus murimartini TaxID=171685 RepID=A0ABT9YIB5_9BACI|nr:YqcI/YcgG family protein [Alkalicoccobacillus murimartini]MDQ0207603.1 FPC/CPF motif-containing protein YcgG [Alkalicoccobacillus murimartini]
MTNQALLTKVEMNDASIVPDWLTQEYRTFHEIVTDKTFPCYFGMKAENKGELRYAYLLQEDWSNLPKAVDQFLKLFTSPPFIRHGLFVFVEPEKEEKTLEYYRDYFWRILQYLHENDTVPWPEESPKDPEHYLWDFHFGGEPIFAFGNAPAYKQRKTRDLGNSLILGFQPRKIFQGLEGTEKGGIMSREKVRERVEVWDQLPTHPDISHFGDPDHNEWKQFFIGDDSKPIKGKCPFFHK